jgi:hypothetical protein
MRDMMKLTNKYHYVLYVQEDREKHRYDEEINNRYHIHPMKITQEGTDCD